MVIVNHVTGSPIIVPGLANAAHIDQKLTRWMQGQAEGMIGFDVKIIDSRVIVEKNHRVMRVPDKTKGFGLPLDTLPNLPLGDDVLPLLRLMHCGMYHFEIFELPLHR